VEVSGNHGHRESFNKAGRISAAAELGELEMRTDPGPSICVNLLGSDGRRNQRRIGSPEVNRLGSIATSPLRRRSDWQGTGVVRQPELRALADLAPSTLRYDYYARSALRKDVLSRWLNHRHVCMSFNLVVER
jgi:hypothetical protein